ncbi:hypothetical protein IAU59_006492 [Kwoniella sp. CBS 9459]
MAQPQEEYVLLESIDGYTFVVPHAVACESGTLRSMLDEDAAFEESKNKYCKIQQRGVILLKVIEYLAYKHQYKEFNAEDIKEDFSDRIDPYIALELLTAADFLEA